MQDDSQSLIDNLASKHLGQKGGEGYSDQYDPSLLVFIPRSLNREIYDIKEDNLPFGGYDVWNAYEVSALTNKGLPVTGMLKIVYPANTKCHVESKSLKLYLNSFNMTKLGDTINECINRIERTVEKDLSAELGESVSVSMIPSFDDIKVKSYKFDNFDTLEKEIQGINDIQFDTYYSDKNILQKIRRFGIGNSFRVHTSLLRSNCRVTGQPDWGDVYIHCDGSEVPEPVSLLKYIISHRKVNHFHEEICEMIYTDIQRLCNPRHLMVCCLYTRRGGIDINPIRASSYDLIPNWYFLKYELIGKTLRQ